MLSYFRQTPLPALHERATRLAERWAALDSELTSTLDQVGQAVAVADGAPTNEIRELRAKVNDLRSQLEEVEAAQAVLDGAIAAARASQSDRERAQRDEAATEAAAGHQLAAIAFDAAVASLAVAYGEYLDARREADAARRSAGWGPMPGRTALPVASALMHQAPDLCRAVRDQLGNTMFFRHGKTRPLAEFADALLRHPGKEIRHG